jgi:SAM-dependent methyltransferase
MSSEAHKSLFSGAVSYYTQYRPNYPRELFDLVVRTFNLNGSGRLLDLGCGPGNVALGLHSHFQEVVAVDLNPEMLAEGKRLAAEAGATNISWLELPAEEIGPELGTFRLVTMGRSFHWMQRDLVLQKAYEILEPGISLRESSEPGGIAILGGGLGRRERERPWWDWIVEGLVRRWRVRERTVSHNADNPQEDHAQVVQRSVFVGLQQGTLRTREQLNVTKIIGEAYSKSGSKPEMFGENRQAFENDVRSVLGMLEPSERFEREREFDYLFAFKR